MLTVGDCDFASCVSILWPAAQNKRLVWDPAGIEDFSLTECHGQTVTKADLLGKPWLACFIFTRCAGPCLPKSQRADADSSRIGCTVSTCGS